MGKGTWGMYLCFYYVPPVYFLNFHHVILSCLLNDSFLQIKLTSIIREYPLVRKESNIELNTIYSK
jgi:hypothetical protein